MTTRRRLLKGVAAAAAGATMHSFAASREQPLVELKGTRQAVHRVLVLQRARREVVRREDLRGREGTRLQVGRTDRPRALGHAQEARPRLRHRLQRHARRAVHARVQQPASSTTRSSNARARPSTSAPTPSSPASSPSSATSGPTPTTPSPAAITTDDAFANCVKGLKELAAHAEKKGVTVCLEHLNTRDDSDPMKGHPGYQGDDLDFVASSRRRRSARRA